MSLNPAQLEAVTTLSGPLLVLSGAGTGKTRVVTYRVAELIRRGTRPDRILAVTFTKKAAAEMRERSIELLGRPKRVRGRGAPQPEMSTFHSLCVRILRRHADKLGYPKKFSICDRGDQEAVARGALREARTPAKALKPGDLLYFISLWKSRSVAPTQAESIAETDREHFAAIAYRRYQQTLKMRGAVDFDDLLLLTEELFKKSAEARREEAGRFDHILIDEYQDTNSSQYQIVRRLAGGHRNLCVVGDDDQSIYGWRGAEVEHILRFTDDWPDAKVVRLETNYRSMESILECANTLIEFNATRYEKRLLAARRGGPRPRVLQFPDENKESEQIARDIAGLIEEEKVEPRDVAILFRTNEQPRPFEAALRQANIPYVLIGSMSFFDRREVRDILAYLKLIIDTNDEPSLLRILNCPPRGIGKNTQQQIVSAAVERGESAWSVIASDSASQVVGPRAIDALAGFRRTIEELRTAAQTMMPSSLIRRVLQTVAYHTELERIYVEPLERDARAAAIEDLVRAAESYEQNAKRPTVQDFLADVVLNLRDDDDKEDQLRRNAVALMTLHSAKGLEFPHVYLVGLEEGILPHKRSVEADDAAIDEERRLCYVGVTRARERLTLSLSLSRRKWGKARETTPSRFLFEMTGQAENWIAMRNRNRAAAAGRNGSAKSRRR